MIRARGVGNPPRACARARETKSEVFATRARARSVNTSDPPFARVGVGEPRDARARLPPGCLGHQVERRLFLDDRGGGLTAVGRQEGQDGRRENDAGPDQECLLVAVGRGLSQAVTGAQD
jgi:hypothetical protein